MAEVRLSVNLLPMSPEIVVAILVFIGAVITSVIGAYATVRSENNKTFAAIRKEANERDRQRDIHIAVLTTKVDVLWEIYAEDAIRQARARGMVATKSPLAPTDMWEACLSLKLTEQIESDAVDFACYLSSPYDVAIEIWNKYKVEILKSNNDSSVRVLWGTILIVSTNAIKAAETTEPC